MIEINIISVCLIIQSLVYSIQHYVMKFVGDLRQVGGFLHHTKTDHHDITEILLKVALNTITHPLSLYVSLYTL